MDDGKAEIAFYTETLKFFSIVEPYQPDRFLRQMGYIQCIPLPPYKPTRVKRGKSAVSYIAKYNFQPEMWERWQDHVLSARSRGNRATYACEAAPKYIPWFLKISHPTIENLEYYIGGNLDGDDLLDRLRRTVDVMLKWRSLPPGEADMTSAFKMADDVLMHLTGKGVASSATTTSGGNEPARKSENDIHATQSQFHTNANESSSSKRR
ncbi:hypothetical protein Sjap_017165 [Stephania japonica]|uniref:Uncharacterized protein n=1 Tax=Stephania japonica TaxID=461633 RepID=A0AAP0NK21_9MAGN